MTATPAHAGGSSHDFRHLTGTVAELFHAALREAGWTDIERIEATNPVVKGRLHGRAAVARVVLFRNGDELRALRAWGAASVPVPAVVASGWLDTAALAGRLEWFALEYIDAHPAVFSVPLVRELFATIKTMHAIDPSRFPHAFDIPSHPVGTWAIDQLALHADVSRLRTAVLALLHEAAPVVVHGDLTPANVLSPAPAASVRPFWVIDPHGVLGPPEQDIASVISSATEHDPAVDWFRVARDAYGPFNERLAAQWIAATDTLMAAVASLDDPDQDWQHVVDGLAARFA